MIRFDLSDNKVASQQSLKDLILHKRNRFRTYCIFILIVVILNALSIWQFYGFGSEMDEPPVLCSFKTQYRLGRSLVGVPLGDHHNNVWDITDSTLHSRFFLKVQRSLSIV